MRTCKGAIRTSKGAMRTSKGAMRTSKGAIGTSKEAMRTFKGAMRTSKGVMRSFCTHFDELPGAAIGFSTPVSTATCAATDLHGALYKNDVFFAFSACE